jgi:protein SCO1/2
MVDPSALHISRRRLLGAGAATGVALALGGCSLQKSSSVDSDTEDPNAAWGGTYLDPPFEKPDVTFTDIDGNPYPLREKTAGRLTALFFGYTSCPDVCPIYLNTLASARASIGSGPGSRPIVLFVGVDPARDEAKMKDYLAGIDETFVGLLGTPETIEQAVGELSLGQPVLHEPETPGGPYLVDHPSTIVVFSPDDTAHRIYPADVRQEQWVKDLPRLDQGINGSDDEMSA